MHLDLIRRLGFHGYLQQAMFGGKKMGLIYVMIIEASWPRKIHNYLRKIHWQLVQSVLDHFALKLGFGIKSVYF